MPAGRLRNSVYARTVVTPGACPNPDLPREGRLADICSSHDVHIPSPPGLTDERSGFRAAGPGLAAHQCCVNHVHALCTSHALQPLLDCLRLSPLGQQVYLQRLNPWALWRDSDTLLISFFCEGIQEGGCLSDAVPFTSNMYFQVARVLWGFFFFTSYLPVAFMGTLCQEARLCPYKYDGVFACQGSEV